jgi:hypothetical protein
MQLALYARDALTQTTTLHRKQYVYGPGGGHTIQVLEVGSYHMLRFETSVTIFPSHYGHTQNSRTFLPLILAVLRMWPRHIAPWATWDCWGPTVSRVHGHVL